MPSFCINKRIIEAVTLYTVHEKCSSNMKLFCLSGEAVLSWWLLLGASYSALRFVCRRCLLGKSVKEEIIYADDILNCCLQQFWCRNVSPNVILKQATLLLKFSNY